MLKEQRPAASAAACTASVLRDRVCFHVDVDTSIEAITVVQLVVSEGGHHDDENPGPDRVDLLTVMSTDDGFAEGLRLGIPAHLDAENLPFCEVYQ